MNVADASDNAQGGEDARPTSEVPSAVALAPFHALVRRTLQGAALLGLLAALAAVVPLGWSLAASLAFGTALGCLNFYWLAKTVNAVGERVTNQASHERGAIVVFRGLLRLGLIVLFAYVIFSCSVRGFVGYAAGLAMPVFALMGEAVYELLASLRRTS